MWTSLHPSTASLHLFSCPYLVFLTQQALSARGESIVHLSPKHGSHWHYESMVCSLSTTKKAGDGAQSMHATHTSLANVTGCATAKYWRFQLDFHFSDMWGGGGCVVELLACEQIDGNRVKGQWNQSNRRNQTLSWGSSYGLTTTVSSSGGWKHCASTINTFYYYHWLIFGKNWACCCACCTWMCRCKIGQKLMLLVILHVNNIVKVFNLRVVTIQGLTWRIEHIFDLFPLHLPPKNGKCCKSILTPYSYFHGQNIVVAPF